MKGFLLLLIICIGNFKLNAQDQCSGPFAKIFGNQDAIERGYSIAFSPNDNRLYLGGIKNDSVAILKLTETGDIEWIRTFDVVSGIGDHVHRILVDSDGMIVIAGIAGTPESGGSVFAFRYNPNDNTMLWCNRYISTGLNYAIGINEIVPGGDFLMTNNPHVPFNNAELIKLNRITGEVDVNFSAHYDVGSSESLGDFVYHDGFLYSTGRFTDGPSEAEMRNTLIKLDPSNGAPVWTILGHKPKSAEARLYGVDLVIDQNEIFSLSLGDPDGTSINFTQIYLQKTSLEGEVQWLKQYELPGANDWADEIISSDNGFVIMARNRTPPSDIILFKIDRDGNVLWANKFDFSNNDNSVLIGGVQSQLIESNNHIYFTAYADFGTTSDIILVKTDQFGNLSDTCSAIEPIEITVNVLDPIFYTVEPDVTPYIPNLISLNLTKGELSDIGTREVCGLDPTIHEELNTTICHGNQFEGYTEPGTYSDTFVLASGCDSIRILNLNVVQCDQFVRYNLNDCTSFMTNGTNMDYTEFVPEYVSTVSCAQISASTVFRDPPQMNKHSCTPGVNGTEAMCISALDSCTYASGDQASLVIEVSIDPDQDSVFSFTGIEFYEKAPVSYNWISGPSGLNNYPTLFGIRILKNNVEIYKEIDIPTSLNWSLKSFNFIENELFKVIEPTVFRIELLPYCLIGNGEPVAAWDIEDIVLLGGCLIAEDKKAVIIGYAGMVNGDPHARSEMLISQYYNFINTQSVETTEYGMFAFENLTYVKPYFVKGFNNKHPLNGVTTLDLIRIQKHLLGMEAFTNPAQYIAADVDKNQKVNIQDILILKKLLLGIYSEFPGNTSWRMWITEEEKDFSDYSLFNDVLEIEQLNADTTRIHVLSIKTGDVTGDALNRHIVNQTSVSPETYRLTFENQWLTAGTPCTLDIKASSKGLMEGLQMAFTGSELTIVGIEGKSIDIPKEHYNIDETRTLRISSNLDEPLLVNRNNILFTVTIVPHFTGYLNGHISLSEEKMKSEIYTYEESIPKRIVLDIEQTELNQMEIQNLSIAPNPFKDRIQIKFKLEKSEQVRMTFYNSSGNVILESNNLYSQGMHNVEFLRSDLLQNNGVLFIRMSSGKYSSIQKIIMLQ